MTTVEIDVAKDHLGTAPRPEGTVWQDANDGRGIEALVMRLRAAAPERIVVEATARYEQPLVAALAAGLPVVVINPRQVRDFAKATGKLAKTDVLDAHVLAHFGEALKPEIRPLSDALRAELDALTWRRQQVLKMLTAERNRQQIAALVGVAPLIRDRGRQRGTRAIWGGRAEVHRTLSMATLVATRFNPVIKPFYQRLLQAGKRNKVALVASMHKLLTILNAMVRHQQRRDPDRATAAA